MRQAHVRYLPVLYKNGRLAGIITKQSLLQSLSVLSLLKLAGLITQDSILQAFNAEDSQQMLLLLQQEIMQLRAENQALLESRNRALEQEQLKLNHRLQNKNIEQEHTKEQLEL